MMNRQITMVSGLFRKKGWWQRIKSLNITDPFVRFIGRCITIRYILSFISCPATDLFPRKPKQSRSNGNFDSRNTDIQYHIICSADPPVG